jgi:Zn finger protein HypA/HybF involved in hydrogenase expression
VSTSDPHPTAAAAPGSPVAIQAKARKFPCPSCGASVEWSPGSSSLKCPFCGAQRVIPTTPQQVREQPIDATVGEPAELGWGAERKAVKCTRCGATTTFEPNVAAGSCAFCGAPTVVEAPPDAKMVRPAGLLPFRIVRDAAVNAFRKWLGGLWFRPGHLREQASLTSLKGVYVPFWTFDAATHSVWTAEAGYTYTVTVQALENGRTVDRQEQRVRWEPAEGVLEKLFDDLPVPGSRGIEPRLSQQLEPFPTHELVAYEPAYLAGFLAEEYAVGRDEALGEAKQRMASEIRSECVRHIPGDTYRNLEVDTRYSGVAYKNALLPLWIAAYQYRDKAYRYLVNGVTGKAAGTAPFSWIKVSLVVAAAILVMLLIALAKGSGR